MAVLKLKSTEQGDEYRGHPVNDHGKLRLQYFELTATAEAGDAESEIDLCDLPNGRVRVIHLLSRINHSAFGAARTLNIGHREYQNRDNSQEPLIAEDEDAFAAGVNVANAGNGVALGTKTKMDLYSKGGVKVYATVKGGTIPAGATISGYIAYVYE